MVETIAPVVYGRRSRYLASLALHALAATVTAAATGTFLGALGMLAGAPWGPAGAMALTTVALLYATREAFELPIPLPDAKRQVPEWWRTFFSPPVAATLYGAGLGVAFLTFLSYGTFVAVAAAAIVVGDPMLGAALCAPFGLARAVAVGAVGLRARDSAAAVDRAVEIGASDLPRVLNTAALAAVTATVAVQIW